MRLREYLSVPYLLEAETVEVVPGSWIRRVTYPELPGCTAQCLVVEDALQLLERMRIEMIIAMVGARIVRARFALNEPLRNQVRPQSRSRTRPHG